MYQRKHWKQSCCYGVLTTPRYLHEDDIEFNHTVILGCHFRPSTDWALINHLVELFWHLHLVFGVSANPCKKSNGFRRESSNSIIKTNLKSCDFNYRFYNFFRYLLNFCVFYGWHFVYLFGFWKGLNRKWKNPLAFMRFIFCFKYS